MRSFALLLSAAALSAVSFACGPDCDDPDVTVTLSVESEEVRELPVLASGALSLLDVDVPESHGNEAITLKIEGADSVSIDSIEFTQDVDGAPLDIERTRTLLEDADFADTATAANGDTVRIFWRTKQLSDLGLTAGKPHAGHVKVNWRRTGCRTQTGTAELDIPGEVQAIPAPKNFKLVSAESDRLRTADGVKAKVSLESNAPGGDFLKNIANPSFTVAFFSEGLPPIIGYGTVDKSQVSLQVNGALPMMRTLQNGQVLDVYTSKNPSIGGAPFEYAGQAEASQALVGGGKAVLTLTIDSERGQSQTGVAVTDVITVLVDVP